jgi:stearoyl-CoA desaturase (delta-9 desaturase)
MRAMAALAGVPAAIGERGARARCNRPLSRTLALGMVLGPLAGVAVAAWLAARDGVTALDLSLFVGMYALTGLGISLGFHRHFSHRAFGARPGVRIALGIAGAMAAEGPVIRWAAVHRKHHRYSDRPGDPHSPQFTLERPTGGAGGLWHAYIGWMFGPDLGPMDGYVRDLVRDPVVRAVDAWTSAWVVLGLAIPAACGWWLGGPAAVLTTFLWGGPVRIAALHHATWLVNCVGHRWGGRPFETPDRSRNVGSLALVSLGDSWHNNHHAFPSSPRHGLRWWQVDPSWWTLRLLVLLGWADLPRRRPEPCPRAAGTG